MITLKTVMDFGKYRGLTFWLVLERDITYVHWLITNKVIELDNEAFLKYQELWEQKELEQEIDIFVDPND